MVGPTQQFYEVSAKELCYHISVIKKRWKQISRIEHSSLETRQLWICRHCIHRGRRVFMIYGISYQLSLGIYTRLITHILLVLACVGVYLLNGSMSQVLNCGQSLLFVMKLSDILRP